MENNVQEIVSMVEDKIMSSAVRNNHAVQLFKDQLCIKGDERIPRIVEAAFDIMVKAFIKTKGQTNLTKSLAKVGNMIALHFNIEVDTATAVHLGNIIIDPMITADYLILTQEPFFTLDDIVFFGKKETVRSKVYILEYGSKFENPEREVGHRRGIARDKFEKWDGYKRIAQDLEQRLTKYYGKTPKVRGDEAYVEAVNNLEQVGWEINPSVAIVSHQLKEELGDYQIILDDNRKFDVRDIKREEESMNLHLAKQKLYLGGLLFQPEKGNGLTVDTLEAELTRLSKRISTLKEGGSAQLKAKQRYTLVSKHFEKHNNYWASKKLCLSTRSTVTRDLSILKTIDDWSDGKFYLSMFLDFRGRMYAVEPFCSYQGSDLARGHLMFAEKKVMTSKGYRNLSIHIANSFNQSYEINDLDALDWLELDYKTDLISDGIPSIAVDKMGLNDRVRWAEENLSLFLDIAEDPIATKDIWMNAEKPWVFLALCFEVVNYLFADGDYYSQIPIAIDGASNGTQHLAAMSCDEVAGKMVGLVAGEKPIDFYIEVAKGILKRNIGTDLGLILAGIPMKLIRKGISKRGTMTRAYDAGVGCIAGIIYIDCYDAKMTEKYGITKLVAFNLAKDLVATYNELCQGPVEIKNYLQALVKHQMINDNIITWTTPSDFPVVSEKWIWNKAKTYIYTQGKKIGLVLRDNSGIPSRAEVMSGISPNWVHSMDASHLAMVVNMLNNEGIKSFGAIHDSFSVHAEDVDRLLEITKDTFIDMYSYNVFDYVARQITNNDPMLVILPPKLGKLDLNSIRDSDYFFS